MNAGNARHDLTRGAIAALKSIPFDEGGLQRMELVALRNPLDSGDLPAFDKCGQRQAGFVPLAIHEHCAGTALAEATAFLRAGEMQVLAQCVEQSGAGINRESVLASIDAQR